MEISVGKSAMFFNGNIVVLLLINGACGLTVIRSTTPTGIGDVDRFSNPGCYRALCSSVLGRYAECSTADCCLCHCTYNKPNYVVSQGMCKGNDEVDNGCQIGDTLNEDLPLPVIEVTKSGKLQFFKPEGCSGRGLQNTRWYYRLATNEWIKGPRNAFSIKSDPINPRMSLQWDKGLDVKYTGLILKIIFTCQNIRNPSCLLVKSKGNFTTSNEGSSGVTIDVSRGRSRPTEPSGTTSRKNNGSDMGSAANSKTKKEVQAKRTGVVVAGVTVSLAFGIALVLVTYLLMLKRRRHERTTKGHRYNTPNVVYEDPPQLPSRVQVGTESFHNEFYSSDCVLSIRMENIQSADTVPTRAVRMGSLPTIPTQESIYEEPVIVRTIGYTPLAKESKETHATDDDVLSTEEKSLPAYKVLEQPSNDDDDYDDNISECYPREASAIRKD